MLKAQVIKKLEMRVSLRRLKLSKERADYVKLASRKRENAYELRRIESIDTELKSLNYRTVCGLDYRVRDGVFRNSSGSCEFNPETMYAHSYEWYDLVKVIDGVVVVNSYRYSIQTAKHIWKVQDVLKTLGIKYVELEAPRGLQDLERALRHELETQAARVVASKYGRDKRRLPYKIQDSKALKLLASFGYKASRAMRADHLKLAEIAREGRLERARKARAEKRAIAALEIVIDSHGTMFDEPCYHAVIPQSYAWDDKLGFIGRVSEYVKRSAVQSGFNRIIVHRTERRHLQAVQS